MKQSFINAKASVTIMADFCPEFNPPFRWRCKHQTNIAVHINNLVSFEFPNRSNRSARSFTSTLNLTLETMGHYYKNEAFQHGIWIFYPKMATFGLIHFGKIAHVFIQNMNYQCAIFYTNISTNRDTTNIFLFLAIFSKDFWLFYPKIANFGSIQLGIIANIVS